MEENRYKKLREDYEFRENGQRITMKELSNIFIQKGYTSLTHNAIRKLETGQRNLKNADEIIAYAEFFNVTADYLLGIRNNAIVDENNAMIGKTTGLSDDSIITLKKVKGYWDSKENSILNYVMKDSNLFLDFLSWLSIYIDNDYTIPLAHDKERGDFPCNNALGSIVLGQKIKDNKGNDGFKTIGIGVNILESHAMLQMQQIINKWKDSYRDKKGRD